MLRRHLGTTLAEAKRRPWWEFRLLVDGLAEEFGPKDDDGVPAVEESLETWNPYAAGQVPPGGAASLPDITKLGIQTEEVE
jgi:hypothetical protein